MEFFNDAREHLQDDGIFLQWVQSYGITPEVLGTVITTLKSAFPHVSI
ncbi:MAG: hypothetical protein GY822_21510 [Deltaproteobacteria bacterium]|nr:hypothetical protein [Deltaproteobacteria bacterium]